MALALDVPPRYRFKAGFVLRLASSVVRGQAARCSPTPRGAWRRARGPVWRG
jgi:hypothetical protein